MHVEPRPLFLACTCEESDSCLCTHPLFIMASLQWWSRWLSRVGSCHKLLVGRQLGRAASSGPVSYPLQLSSVSPDHAALYAESLENPEAFWGDLARRRLSWFREFQQVMDCDMHEGRISWFNGGKINASCR